MREIGAGQSGEPLHAQMHHRAYARTAVGQRFCFRIRDQFFDGFSGQCRFDDEDVRLRRHDDDRLEGFTDVEADALQGANQHQRIGCAEDRIAIGRRLRAEIDRYCRAGAGTIVDDDRLTPFFAQHLCSSAGNSIVPRARRYADDDAYRALRIIGWFVLRNAGNCRARENDGNVDAGRRRG